MRASECKRAGQAPAGKEAGHQGKTNILNREIIRFVVSDFLLDLAEHASSKDNYVHGDDPPCLLSSTHRQVAGRVSGRAKNVVLFEMVSFLGCWW